MELRDVLHCNKDLLALLRPHSFGSLSSHAWDGALIYQGTGTQAVNYQNLSTERKLAQLKELYPDLGVFEYLRLNQKLQFSMSLLSMHLHFPVKEDNDSFFSQLLRLPRPLQDHLDHRKVKLSELIFLRAWNLSTTEEQNKALNKIAELGLSLQVSLKTLEILVDLFLMEKSTATVLSAINESEFTSALFQLRNPVSHQIQEQRKDQMAQIRWPAFAKAKVTRRGDRTGFEVQAFIASDADLTKMMATLERAKEQFQNTSHNSSQNSKEPVQS